MTRPVSNKKRKNETSVIGLYNMIPNLIWTIINFTPVYLFYMLPGTLKYIWISLAISLVGLALPASFFNRLQISRSINTYKKLGILIVRKYAQDGDMINKIIRKKFPEHKTAHNYSKYLGKTYFFERFHFVCLLFFLIVSIQAILQSYFVWAILISLANILYNVYPILLQQYNRIRIQQLLSKKR